MVRSRPRPESGDCVVSVILSEQPATQIFASPFEPGCQSAPSTSPTARRTDSEIAAALASGDAYHSRCDRAKTVAGLLISLLANLSLTRRPLGRDCSRAQSQSRTHLQGASRATSLPELWVGLTVLPLSGVARDATS